MKELNRHILSDGIYELPEHKAPSGIWENIDTMMFSVPAHTLPVHKPASSVWVAIEAGISNSIFSRKMIIRSLGVLLLIIISGSIYHYFGNFATNDKISNGKHTEQSSIIPGTSKQETDKIDIYEIADKDYSDNTKPPVFDNHIFKKNKTTSELSKEHELTDENRNDIVSYDEARLLLSQRKLTPINSKVVLNSNKESTIIFSNELKSHNVKDSHKNSSQYCDFNQVDKSFAIGAGVGYQYFKNSTIPENTKMNYWVSTDLMARFKRERLTIETGVGIAFSADKANFSYEYLTNELVDTYEYVDSVHFDPITGTTEYFTTTVDVYDSIPHTGNETVEKKYNYLKIPLVVGYDVWKDRKFSLNINAGITYFMEVKQKEIKPILFHENSRITNITANPVSRNSEFFRISAGIGFSWFLNRKVKLTLNSTYNYFLTPIYTNMDKLGKPTAIGIRCGFSYKF